MAYLIIAIFLGILYALGLETETDLFENEGEEKIPIEDKIDENN